MSLKRTYRVLRIRAIPKPKANISRMKNGVKREERWKCTLAENIITTKTIKFKHRLIKAETELDKTMTYFGKFSFLKTSPRETIADNPPVVMSEKKFQSTIPNNKDTGQWGTSPPTLKKWTNTRYKIKKRNRGLSRDHRYPSTDPWYFNLNSVITNSFKRIKE